MNSKEKNPDLLRIGENIRRIFQQRKLATGIKTSTDLAKAANIERSTLSKIGSGARQATALQIQQIADALGVHPGHLIEGILDRYPYRHIPSPNTRGAAAKRKGRAVSHVDYLLADSRTLSSFFGGISEEHLPYFHEKLTELKDLSSAKRATIAQDERSPPPDS